MSMTPEDLGECRTVVADAEPFGIDVHQGTGLAHSRKRDGARTAPARIAHGYDHVTRICIHGKYFDLACNPCGQGSRFGGSSGEIRSGEVYVGSS